MGFTSFSELKNAIRDGQIINRPFSLVGASGSGVGWMGHWYGQSTSSYPVLGADPAAGSGTPGAGGTSYSSTDGGILYPNTAGDKFLINCQIRMAQTSSAMFLVVDRLVGVGSITMSGTGSKNIGSPTLPRYTSAEGVECYLEVKTAGTTTAPIVHLSSYTNQDGTTGRSGGTITFTNTTFPVSGLVGPLPLQAGDVGVKSVETLTVDTAGGGSGVCNLLLVKPLFILPMSAFGGSDTPNWRTWPLPYAGLIQIYDGATLMILNKNTSASVSRVYGSLTVVEG